MTTVERRYRQQVDQTKVDRDHRCQQHKGYKTLLQGRSRDFRDTDGALNLAGLHFPAPQPRKTAQDHDGHSERI